MKTALILGVSGQTGSYLSHLLLTMGYTVHGTSRDIDRNSFANLVRLGCRDRIQLHAVSADDYSGVTNLLERIGPSEVYYLSGPSSVAQSFEQPIQAFERIAISVLNILEFLRQNERPTRFFHAASSDCFGETEGLADESTPFRPRSPYAIAKAAAFWAVASYRQSYGLHCCSGILSNHESPFRPQQFVTRKVVESAIRIADGSTERLRMGNLEILRDWGWAPDYAQAIWDIMQSDAPDDFVVATGQSYTLQEFVDTTFTNLGLDWSQHVDIDPTLFRPFEVGGIRLNPAKIRAELGWSANMAMPQLVEALLACQRSGTPGWLPWLGTPLSDALV